MAELEELGKAADQASDTHEAALQEVLRSREAVADARRVYDTVRGTTEGLIALQATKATFHAAQSAHTHALTVERQTWARYLLALRALNTAQHEGMVRLLEQSRLARLNGAA